MSKAASALKIQNTINLLDELYASWWNTDYPVGALDITVTDDFHEEKTVELTFEHLIDDLIEHFTNLQATEEKQALENWNHVG